MIDKAVHDAINTQIKMEFDSAYIYLAMSAHFEDANFEGFAKWMRLQAAEEKEHAMRLFDYLVERGAKVTLKGIADPPGKFGSPREIFQQALEHERKVSKSINDIYALAVEKNDYPTQVMLQWFIDEQVEEESTAEKAVRELEMAGDNTAALLMLDRAYGARQ
jgi:ferritin